MTTIQERLQKNIIFEAIKIYVKKNHHWDKYTSFLRKLYILKRIGNDSKYGQVYQGYFNLFKSDANSFLSLKIIPLHPLDLDIMLQQKHMNHQFIFQKKTIWKEIYVLRLCSQLLKMKKSIHLPIHYFCLYSNNHDFLKPYTKEAPHILVFNELADDDLKNWSKQERTIHEWSSCILQIFFGLYVLQYYAGILHNDLHWANVLVFNVKKGGYWCYNIENKKYYIENLGYLFVLWDFGMSSIESNVLQCKDHHAKSCHDFIKILNLPKWIHKYYPNNAVPSEFVSMCAAIRSQSYSCMNDLLHGIINKLSHNTNQTLPILEEYII